MKFNRVLLHISYIFGRHRVGSIAVVCMVLWIAMGPAAAETLTFDDGSTLDAIMARHPGWSYTQDKNGKASLEAGVTGKCFCASFGGGNSIVTLNRTFSTGKQTIYVGFTLKVTAIQRMLTGAGVMRLTSAGQPDVVFGLGDGRGVILSTNLQGTSVNHYPGAYWWPDKWIRYIVGISKGPNGFVKIWQDGACIYSNSFDTDSKLIDGVVFGLPNSWDGEYVTAKALFDDVSVGDTFGQAGSEPGRKVTAASTVQRIVNPDCFGVHLGWWGWGWRTDYPNVRAVAKQIGFSAGRFFLEGNRNWDYHWPYFNYKPTDADPPGSTVAEHLLAISNTTNPLMMCFFNIFGESGSSWKPDKAIEQIRYNQTYVRPDGGTGLRSVYELGNEPSLCGPITEGWYYHSGNNSYEQVGCGSTTYRSTFSPDSPEFLSNTNAAYNYRLDFNAGDYLYLGDRWRFNSIAYALANRSTVTAGNMVLRWEYWNGTNWVRFGTPSRCPFLNQYPKPATNFSGKADWCFCVWDDATIPDWTRTSMADISGGTSASHESLYWIRVSQDGNGLSYGTTPPVESFVSGAMSPAGYLEAMQAYYAPITDAGAELYASPGNEGERVGFLDVMQANSGLFDGLMWHHYPDLPISTSMKPGGTYAPPSAMLWSIDRIALRAADLQRMFPGKKLGLSEWNSSGTPTQPDVTLACGLMAAIGICQILQSGWDSAIYHSLFCGFYNPHSIVSENVDAPRLRPGGQALKAIHDHCKRYVISTKSTYPGIYACGFSGSNSNDGSLVIVNRTPNTETMQVSMPRQWKKRLAVFEMTASSLSADNETADNVVLKYKKTIGLGSSMTTNYSFPPYSLTIFDTTLP